MDSGAKVYLDITVGQPNNDGLSDFDITAVLIPTVVVVVFIILIAIVSAITYHCVKSRRTLKVYELSNM